ncbi:sensor histidine kinase [Corallococcus sp. H22C18031201]|nr:sensor histidine kinase [Corallococcus sp. H22C18031201]
MTSPAHDSAPRPWRWQWPQVQPRTTLLVWGICLVMGLWQGTVVRLALLADGSPLPASRPLVWEVTGALSAALLLPIMRTAALNAPRPRVGWTRFLGIHAIAFALYTSLHIVVMVVSRHALYSLFGWGDYHYGVMAFRVPMEVQKDVIAYGIAITAIVNVDLWRARHERALREATLESELRTAQLQSLTGQLQPHFLFNALNTISSVMYEDLGRTDRMLSDLGQLLRASLARTEPTWTLAEERAHSERYVALLAARFGERLVVRWSLAPALDSVRVPCFALQTLVENAVKHNQDLLGVLEVRIRADAEGARWRLEVEDTGRGFGAPSPEAGPGVGLSHLSRVLALLHGPQAALERSQGPEGGARVTLWLPREAA